jgi:tRNA(fMet)-specific endonuclease VapC
MFVLDTDVCILALRHEPVITARLASHSPVDINVTTMTEAELRYGALRSRDPVSSSTSMGAFLAPLARLSFDSAAAELHAQLRYDLRRRPIGERDLVIASTALAHGAELVTRNAREFRRVEGLTLHDWATPPR